MLCVPLNMGMSATHCQGNVREFQSVWRVVTLFYTDMPYVRLAPYFPSTHSRRICMVILQQRQPSPKCPIMCRAGRQTLLTHSLQQRQSRNFKSLNIIMLANY